LAGGGERCDMSRGGVDGREEWECGFCVVGRLGVRRHAGVLWAKGGCL
jgi:hypothetical protein